MHFILEKIKLCCLSTGIFVKCRHQTINIEGWNLELNCFRIYGNIVRASVYMSVENTHINSFVAMFFT